MHGVYYIKDPAQIAALSGLILPEVLPRVEEASVFPVGAVEEDRAVGAAVMALERGRARLLSIAVSEKHRRQGIGTALLRQCVRMLRRTTIQDLYAILTEDELDAAALLASFGMTQSAAPGAYYSFPLDSALEQSVLNGTARGSVPLASVPNGAFRDYIRTAFPADTTLGQRTLFDPEISQVLMENGRVTACLLAERSEMLSIGWLASRSREKLAPLYLLRGALSAASAVCPPETPVQFAAYDETVMQLTEQLLPRAEKHLIQSWELAGGAFRLTDTARTGWEAPVDAGRQTALAPEN